MIKFLKDVWSFLGEIKEGYKQFRKSDGGSAALMSVGYILYIFGMFTFGVQIVFDVCSLLHFQELATDTITISMEDGTTGYITYEYMEVTNVIGALIVSLAVALIVFLIVIGILMWDEILDWLYAKFCLLAKLVDDKFIQKSKASSLVGE